MAGAWTLALGLCGCEVNEGTVRIPEARAAFALPGEPGPAPAGIDAGGLRGPVLRAADGIAIVHLTGGAPDAGRAGTACAAAETQAARDVPSIRDQVDLQRIRRCARRWWWS